MIEARELMLMFLQAHQHGYAEGYEAGFESGYASGHERAMEEVKTWLLTIQ